MTKSQKKECIHKTKEYIKERFLGEEGAHDWWHIYRVWKLAQFIGEKEKADFFVVELAALLHDIADWKFHGGDSSVGPQKAREWLEQLQVEEAVISTVADIVAGISFKGAGVDTKLETLEGKVVQDADRLDAIGAIGIARCFAYGGNRGHEIYNPEIKPQMHESFEKYKNSKSPSINHFYEKLLLLKDLMNSETGKDLAEKRHHFMREFLDEFIAEWEGER